jgi:hypothetical protein
VTSSVLGHDSKRRLDGPPATGVSSLHDGPHPLEMITTKCDDVACWRRSEEGEEEGRVFREGMKRILQSFLKAVFFALVRAPLRHRLR